MQRDLHGNTQGKYCTFSCLLCSKVDGLIFAVANKSQGQVQLTLNTSNKLLFSGTVCLILCIACKPNNCTLEFSKNSHLILARLDNLAQMFNYRFLATEMYKAVEEQTYHQQQVPLTYWSLCLYLLFTFPFLPKK